MFGKTNTQISQTCRKLIVNLRKFDFRRIMANSPHAIQLKRCIMKTLLGNDSSHTQRLIVLYSKLDFLIASYFSSSPSVYATKLTFFVAQ